MTVQIKNHETLDDKTYTDITEIKANGDQLYLYDGNNEIAASVDVNTSTIII